MTTEAEFQKMYPEMAAIGITREQFIRTSRRRARHIRFRRRMSDRLARFACFIWEDGRWKAVSRLTFASARRWCRKHPNASLRFMLIELPPADLLR